MRNGMRTMVTTNGSVSCFVINYVQYCTVMVMYPVWLCNGYVRLCNLFFF